MTSETTLSDLRAACCKAVAMAVEAEDFADTRRATLQALAIQADGIRLQALRAAAAPDVVQALEQGRY